MTILSEQLDYDAFFRTLRAAPSRLLMLDYDGTLAPFTPHRDRATPFPGLRPLLQKLASEKRCRTVIVSGRAVADLLPLLQLNPLPEIWGSHGWERMHADGTYTPPPLDENTRRILAEEWNWLKALFPGDRIEQKPASVALHWRGLEPETEVTLRGLASKRWSNLLLHAPVEMHAFDGGIELRTLGRSKADAVHTLLSEFPTPPAAAYLGDDQTDEDAFAALDGRGLRVLVRPELRPTRADLHLTPPDELIRFLNQWISHLS
ncbi:MAG: trehalose-phosphatase [Bacteroidetes bacterium]|nr:trehalose-phosphatase [Bacteroidota bacterium]